jgi:rhamnose transport system permease protein
MSCAAGARNDSRQAEMTTANPAHSQSAEPSRLQRLLLRQETILFVILVVGVLLLSMQSDKFLTIENLLNQGRLAAEIALVALPMTLIIITGGIDLSVGSIMGLVAIMLGVAWYNWGLPLELAIVVALLIGTACGLFNGLFITRVGLPPLITTLATLALFRGLAEGIAQARSVRGYPEWFYILGQKNFLGDLTSIPNQLLIVVLSIIAIGAALAWTPFGRSLYAIGNNETGARFSGLPVQRNKLIIYTLSGFMAGLAAWVYVSRVSTTRSDMGNGIELTAITAVVVGGTSIFGGSGTILGTVLGLALIQLMKNGLALSGAKGDSTTIVVGVILIAAVLLNQIIQNPPERLKRLLPGQH